MSDPPRMVCVGGTVRPGSPSGQALRIAARRVEDQGCAARVVGRTAAL